VRSIVSVALWWYASVASAQQVIGAISPKAIEDLVRAHERALARCPAKLEQIALRFVIGENGELTELRVSTPAEAQAAQACVSKQVERWRFPRPEHGTVEVTWDFGRPRFPGADARTLAMAGVGAAKWEERVVADVAWGALDVEGTTIRNRNHVESALRRDRWLQTCAGEALRANPALAGPFSISFAIHGGRAEPLQLDGGGSDTNGLRDCLRARLAGFTFLDDAASVRLSFSVSPRRAWVFRDPRR